MKILRRGFLHINILSYLDHIFARVERPRDPKVLLHCFLFFALLVSRLRQLDTITSATHCLRAAFQYNRVRTPHESLGRKCLGVSLAHPDASTIYQKLNLAAFDSDSNQIDRCKLSQFLTNETFDLCRAIFRRFRNSIFENSKNCAILQKRDLFLKFIIP